MAIVVIPCKRPQHLIEFRPVSTRLVYALVVLLTAATLAMCGPDVLVERAAASSPDGSDFVALPYTRLLDTQSGTGGPAQPFAAQERRDLQVSGMAGVPSSGVEAVVVDVAVTSATATNTTLSVWNPDQAAPPTVAQLRYGAADVPRSALIHRADLGLS